MTTGEGGAVLTDRDDLAERLRRFRNHGIATELAARTRLDLRDGRARLQLPADRHRGGARERAARAAGGRSSPGAGSSRRATWSGSPDHPMLELPAVDAGRGPGLALHVRAAPARSAARRPRRGLPRAARREHRRQRPLHPGPHATRTTASAFPGLSFPVAEAAYERLLTLPLHAGMDDADVDDVVAALDKVTGTYAGDGAPGSTGDR